jgi:RHS repeat-associated protein
VTELTVSGSAPAAPLHTNFFPGGKLLATYDFTGAQGLHYALADPLGTKRVQFTINSSGLETTELNCLSLPFGNSLNNSFTTDCVPVGTSGADATEHHFTGKERDAESGNDYFGARYYSSSMGRFMSPDWSAKAEPVPYAKLDDPQSLNLYAYVGNNPLTQVDADGHCWPQWLCNKVAQAFINVATLGVVAYIHHEAKVTAQHRQYLIDNGYTLVNGSNKEVDLKSASAKEVNQAYGQAQADQFRQALGLASQIPTVPGAGSIAPEEGTGGEATPESAQMKRLSNGEIKQLQENGIDPHDLKPNSKYDLFKNSDGEIFVKPKAGNGPGETTGLNIKDYQ